MRPIEASVHPGAHAIPGNTEQTPDAHRRQLTAFDQTPHGPRRHIAQLSGGLLKGPQQAFFRAVHISSPRIVVHTKAANPESPSTFRS
jgi:hypothetical protein